MEKVFGKETGDNFAHFKRSRMANKMRDGCQHLYNEFRATEHFNGSAKNWADIMMCIAGEMVEIMLALDPGDEIKTSIYLGGKNYCVMLTLEYRFK